jgi:hypothetical protein
VAGDGLRHCARRRRRAVEAIGRLSHRPLLTGRTVRMFLSGILGESWVEVFVLDSDGAENAGAAG